MDIATIVGVLSGIGLVVGSILMNSGIDIFIDVPSLMIVIGGTIAATLINYPLKEFLKVMGLFGRVFMSKTSDPLKIVDQMVDLGNVAKKEGLLSLEKSMKETKDGFLKKALQMTVDGLPTDTMEVQLKQEISVNVSSHRVGWEIMGAMGTFCPAFGMVGTLIGLIQMLADLSDPSTIGPKMAVAMITTFYGSLFANLFFLPMAGKLQRRSASETQVKTLLYEGVMGIRNGENPKIMRDRLMIYVEAKKGKKGKGEK